MATRCRITKTLNRFDKVNCCHKVCQVMITAADKVSDSKEIDDNDCRVADVGMVGNWPNRLEAVMLYIV